MISIQSMVTLLFLVFFMPTSQAYSRSLSINYSDTYPLGYSITYLNDLLGTQYYADNFAQRRTMATKDYQAKILPTFFKNIKMGSFAFGFYIEYLSSKCINYITLCSNRIRKGVKWGSSLA